MGLTILEVGKKMTMLKWDEYLLMTMTSQKEYLLVDLESMLKMVVELLIAVAAAV